MPKCVLDGNQPECSCKVELHDEPASARILYCPMHAHCGEMHSVLKSLDLNVVNAATSIAAKNVLAKMERASA